MSAESIHKLKRIIEKKRTDDPEGFRKAFNNGDLVHYLSHDLKSANIDPSALSMYLDSLRKKSNSDLSKEFNLDEMIETASSFLDENIYEPYYQGHVSSNYMGIAEVLSKYKSSATIMPYLKKLKVVSAAISLFGIVFAIKNMTQSRVLQALLLGAASFDLLNISYNCYDKRYCSLYINMIGGDMSKVGDTIYKFVKSAMGITDNAQDPLIKLYTEIQWILVLNNTITKALLSKVALLACHNDVVETLKLMDIFTSINDNAQVNELAKK